MRKNNGGPAFPVDTHTSRAWACFENAKKPLSDSEYQALIEQLQTGATLRDYFAVHASYEDVKAQAEVIRQQQMNATGLAILTDDWITTARYMHADAMLAERSKP